jgi:RNA polymerase sporulation-specific sigma factor
MNYRELNDHELLSYIAESHGEAEEIIFHKYEPLIHSTAKRMYTYCKNTGLELNDLIQEGMLGLNQAIVTYKDNKDTMFFTYAKTCIESKDYLFSSSVY